MLSPHGTATYIRTCGGSKTGAPPSQSTNTLARSLGHRGALRGGVPTSGGPAAADDEDGTSIVVTLSLAFPNVLKSVQSLTRSLARSIRPCVRGPDRPTDAAKVFPLRRFPSSSR